MANPVVNGIELEFVEECQLGSKSIKNAYWFASGGASMYIKLQPDSKWLGRATLFGFASVSSVVEDTMEDCATSLGVALKIYLQGLNSFHGCSVT